ncbi:MAG: DEAD/DEAH box helicase [Nitrososphaerales archaeon]
MRIKDLPIPEKLIRLIESLGYFNLYPPQEEAVKAGVLEGQNLLLTTPTASGKTLVAMLAAGKIVLEGLGKVVYLTPLRALANEKYNDFKAFENLIKPNGNHVKVLISTGDYDSSGESLGLGDILILTNEKFDSVLRHGVSWIDSVKLFVTDEIHIVGDDDRGPTLEMTVTKILSYANNAQVLALSATVKNSKELADWLGAKLIDIKWRPIKLIEGVYQHGEIIFSDDSKRKIKPTNRGHAIDVAIDAINEGGQSLIFTETRKMAVSLALKASELTQHHLTKAEVKKAKELSMNILSSGEETELSRTLSKVVEKGTAFHHAGLTGAHRSIIEDGFKNGLIKILTATPTLAAGVNLPARRVVISSLMRYDSDYGGKAPISVLEYKQMCLPYWTKVLISDGTMMPIGEIVEKKVADRVITFDKRKEKFVYGRIIDWFSRETDCLLEIETSGGLKIRLTPEHPILTKERGWISAKNVKIGERVGYAREFEYIPDKNLLFFFKHIPINGTYLKNTTDLFDLAKLKFTRKELATLLGKDLKVVKEYVRGKKAIPLSVILALCKLLNLSDNEIAERLKEVKTAYGTPLKIPKYINEEFMWLLGFIASYGNIEEIVDKRTKSVYHKIRVFNKNPKIIDKTIDILHSLGLFPYVRKKDNYTSVEVGSTLLANLMRKFGIPFGTKDKLRVAETIFSFPPNLIGAYLMGVFDGDGNYIELKSKSTIRRIVISTASEEFAYDLHNLLIRLGIVSYIKKTQPKPALIRSKRAEFKKPVYNIIFRKIRDIKKFTSYGTPVKYNIPFIDYSKYHNLNKYHTIIEPVEWLKVKYIKIINEKTKVYNISVEDTENYIAENFIVHNCGRAGRPKYDDIGETVIIAHNQYEADEILYNYIKGEPEPISSKLHDESALRIHLLATIASLPGITDVEILKLLSKSLLAIQYRHAAIQSKVNKVINYLLGEGLIERRGKRYIASEFGKRVSTLYIDPLTGVIFKRAINLAKKNNPHLLGFLHLIVSSPDFSPKFPLRSRDIDEAQRLFDQNKDEFILPLHKNDIYEDYFKDFRSLLVLYGWINEWSEDKILDKLGVEPGDLHRAVETSEWLVHSLFELSKLLGRVDLLPEIAQLEQRVKQGIKPELIPLAKLEGIGRVRARSLYNHGFTDLDKLASASIDKIASIPKIGIIMAKSIKKQLQERNKFKYKLNHID